MYDIPEILKQRLGWILWKYVDNRKFPVKLDGTSDKWNKTRYSYTEVINAFTAEFDGIGLQPLDDLACIDLDDCLGPDGKFIGPAAELINQETYIEWSPSGNGLHIWFLQDGSLTTQAKPGFELFAGSKFVTITGEHLNTYDVDKISIDVSKYLKIDRRLLSHTADPMTKPGLIGAFCRVYNIHDAMALLPDVYQRISDDRYHYIPSKSAPGVLTYEDKYVISNHATDPAYGGQHNAFDIVKIHKFGNDKKYLNDMLDMISKDDKVQKEALKEFGDDWSAGLILNKNGNIKQCMGNICLIIKNNFSLKYNILENLIELDEACWFKRTKALENSDFIEFKLWFEKYYGFMRCGQMIEDCICKVARENAYNPVKDMLENLPKWDGVKRAETLLIDCFGADNNAYTKAVTKKFLAAAIKRIYEPGCKFDHVLTLIGPQSIGKSTLLRDLSMGFFSDDFNLQDTRDKKAAEKILGKWVIEFGEMAGARKSDVAVVKSFITRQEDRFRPAYGRTTEQFPRCCVFAATSNDDYAFLRDTTGNRRWWIVACRDKNKRYIDFKQVWAEVMTFWKNEKLYLEDLEAEAEKIQDRYVEKDERTAMVLNWIESPIPDNWYDMTIDERRFYQPTGKECKAREFISTAEVWVECFRNRLADITDRDSKNIIKILRILKYKPVSNPRYWSAYGKLRLWRKGNQA